MAGMRLLGAAGQGALECGAAVGEAGRAPGVWGKGAAGTLELELLWVGRKVGFALRTPSIKHTDKQCLELASEFYNSKSFGIRKCQDKRKV